MILYLNLQSFSQFYSSLSYPPPSIYSLPFSFFILFHSLLSPFPSFPLPRYSFFNFFLCLHEYFISSSSFFHASFFSSSFFSHFLISISRFSLSIFVLFPIFHQIILFCHFTLLISQMPPPFFPLISLSVSSRSPENAHPFHVIYPSPSNGYNHPLLTPSPLPIYLHPANPIPDHHRNPLRLKWPTSFFPECQIFGIS